MNIYMCVRYISSLDEWALWYIYKWIFIAFNLYTIQIFNNKIRKFVAIEICKLNKNSTLAQI